MAMFFNLSRKLITGSLLSVILVTLLGVLTIRTFNRQIEEDYWVEHTYKVLNQTERVQKVISDMELSRRGYRSTSQESYLNEFAEKRIQTEPELKELSLLVADNPSQLRRLDDLKSRINDLMNFYKSIKIDYRNSTIEQRVKITDAETKLAEEISKVFSEIKGEERKLLSIRQDGTNKLVKQSRVLLVIGILLILLIVGFLIYSIIGEFRSRRKAERQLVENLENLQKLNQISNEKNWLLTGVSIINDSLTRNSSTQSVLHNMLLALIKYFELPAGGVYLYDEKSKQLKLSAGIGYPAKSEIIFGLNEGIPGQMISKKEISVLRDVPGTYFNLSSASGAMPVGTLIGIPLWLNEELVGLIELPGFKEPEKSQLNLLSIVANNIAIAINSAVVKEKEVLLLDQVISQKEELERQQEELSQTNYHLEAQQEELRQTNEELLKQAETLQVSEEELIQANLELHEKNTLIERTSAALADKANELEEISKYKSEFLANMSHELRTPLNSILILADLLGENNSKNLTEKQLEYAKIIYKAGSDLLQLINDILDLAKIEAGKVELIFENTSVEGIVADLNQLFSVFAREKNIAFKSSIDPGTPIYITTDKHRLEQVLKNLLSNAFKFTSEGGSVLLKAGYIAEQMEDKPTGFYFSVEDTGIGIEPEKQLMIFNAFQQANGTTNRKFGGTGLGLSISKELVSRMGGEITLKSVYGKGSNFTVNLPEEAESISAGKPASVANNSLRTLTDDRLDLNAFNKTILIIEDDLDFAGILRDLARARGYKVLVATDGRQGWMLAEKHLPSAIILDFGLPEMNGNQLLEMLKQHPDLSSTPVFIISGSESGTEGLNAIGSLQKPVSIAEIEAVFSAFNREMGLRIEKVLVLESTGLNKTTLEPLLIDSPRKEWTFVQAWEQIHEHLESGFSGCIIAGISGDIKDELTLLAKFSPIIKKRELPLILFLDTEISAADELKLKSFSDTIISSSTLSEARVTDELERFFNILKKHESAASASTNVSLQHDLQGLKILLADDDVRNLFALTAVFDEHGIDTLTAIDGESAIELLNKNPDTDIVLMDVMMPGIDGLEATRRIRAQKQFEHLPIIAVTAKAMKGDADNCMEAGATDYITKPLNMDTLFAMIKKWHSKK